MNLTVDFSKGLWGCESAGFTFCKAIVTGLGRAGNVRSFRTGHKEGKFGVRVCCLSVKTSGNVLPPRRGLCPRGQWV